jgi:DNA mismatch endonuclease Vsr
MADVFSPEKRSEVMARVRGANTKPELRLRSMLHRLGYRFTVNGPQNKFLPGRPDIVLPSEWGQSPPANIRCAFPAPRSRLPPPPLLL